MPMYEIWAIPHRGDRLYPLPHTPMSDTWDPYSLTSAIDQANRIKFGCGYYAVLVRVCDPQSPNRPIAYVHSDDGPTRDTLRPPKNMLQFTRRENELAQQGLPVRSRASRSHERKMLPP